MRKNYTRILAAMAASFAVLSCMQTNPEEEPLSVLPDQYVATFESSEGDDAPDTKVSLGADNTTVTWDEGDKVAFISSGGKLVSTWNAGTVDQNGKRAIFDLYSGSADAPAAFAVYPNSGLPKIDGSYYVNGRTIECIASEKQSGLYKDADIMVAQIKSNSLKFYHVSGIFELKVSDSKVKKIVVEDSSGQKISGGIYATFSTTEGIEKIESRDLDSKTITVENVTPGTWYVAVRPETYDAGTITISYLDDKDAVVTSVKYPDVMTVRRKDIIAFGDISEHTSMSGTLPAGKTFNNHMEQLAGNLKNITQINFNNNSSNTSGTKIAEDVYMSFASGVISVRTSKSQFTADKDCSNMFDGCPNLTAIIGLDVVNTSETTDMSQMFYGCESLEKVYPTGYFSTANVTTMGDMFYNCKKLEELDLSTWNTRKVTNMGYMFEWNSALNKVVLGKNFVMSDGCFVDEMLLGCTPTFYGTTEEMESFQKNLVLDNDYFDGKLHFAIDMGNAGWWSAWNNGANKPTDFGYYYSWGNITGHIRNGVSDGYTFTESAYTSTDGCSRTTDWQSAPDHGSQWRMPGSYDFENLFTYCEATATTVDGVSGYTFTNKSNGNSIFFPNAGSYLNSTYYTYAHYWASENDTDKTAVIFGFDEKSAARCDKFIGMPVRPVAKLGDVPVEGIFIDVSSWSPEVGERIYLTATVTPSNATNKHFTWSSSDPSVARLYGATGNATAEVRALAPGTATITATTADGSKTASLTVTVKQPLPDGALSGAFSVSATKKVHFSKGNLQATYDGSKYSWGFAKNQYDYIDNAPGNTTIDSQTKGAVVDLFGWSTSSTNYGISTSTKSTDYSGDFVDWGKNIGDGKTWRTLSKEEWVYLFQTRSNASGLYKCGVEVCGKTGCLIIAPDGFTGTIASSYDASTWPSAEAAGLVCLPAAHGRKGSIVNTEKMGFYSTSIADDGSYIYLMLFSSVNISNNPKGYRYYGYSVRLVTDVK